MTLRSDDFEPSASASSASPPQRSSALLHFSITKIRGVIAHASLLLLFGDRLVLLFGFRPPYVDRGGVEAVLEVGSVVFLDHLNAGAAVLRDLINVRAFHETQADVGVPQAVGRAGLSFTVFLETFFVQDGVEELPVGLRKNRIGRLRLVPLDQPLERPDGPAGALAIADAAFAADLDLKDGFMAAGVIDDLHIAIFKAARLVRSEAGIGHEQDIVVKLFRFPFVAVIFRTVCPSPGGFIKLLVFLRGKPRTVGDLPGRPVGLGQIRKPVQPSVAHGGFEGLPENNDFLMHGAPGRWLSVFLHRFLVAMNAVLLHLARRDLGKSHVAEEGHQVNPEARAVALNVLGIALALGDDLVFALELHSGFAEGFLAGYLTVPDFAAQPQKPVLGEVLGLGEAVLLGRDAPVLAGEIGRTLPQAAVVAAVNVDFAAEDRVFLWHSGRASKTAKLCKACVSIPEESTAQLSR